MRGVIRQVSEIISGHEVWGRSVVIHLPPGQGRGLAGLCATRQDLEATSIAAGLRL